MFCELYAVIRWWFYGKSLYFCRVFYKTKKLKVSGKQKKPTAILRMHCPDQPGIIAVITDFITTNRGNIIYLDQYVDRVNGIFYMRVEWELENFLIPSEKINEYFTTLLCQAL